MIWAARKLRGRTSYSDAFFPIFLLTWQGTSGDFLWSTELQHVVPLVLAGTVLVIMAHSRTQVTFRSAVLAGLCIILLPWCGGTGPGLVPTFAVRFRGPGLTLVADGGLAAVAAARHEARVGVVQDRSRPGGNAGSEVKIHVVGPNSHKGPAGARADCS
jgi:hypothetical protein